MKKSLGISVLGASLGALSFGCSVDLDEFSYDQAEFDAAVALQNGDGDGDGDGDAANASEECIEFCAEAGESCAYGADDFYADQSECFDSCEDYVTSQFDCRSLHLSFATAAGSVPEDPSFHCSHASLDGGGTCADASPGTCSDFCAEVDEVCALGDDGPYADEAECEAACADFSETGLECRSLAALEAADDQDECANTAAMGNCEDL